MPIAQSDQLYYLIKSLDKSEKRNFTLYASRLTSKKNPKFLKLFDVIDKMPGYNEKIIQRKFPQSSSGQIANLKRHLYSQILKSLRLIHINKEIDLQIREQLDFARILYGKGLYLQALKLLDRTKLIAESSNQDLLLFEVLEFEKTIESRHITRSRKVKNKVEDLIKSSSTTKRLVNNASDLANLNLKTQGLFIKIGHIKDEKDLFIVKDYFYSNLPELDYDKLGFFEKVYLHQSYVWFYYTILNFPFAYKHALQWVNLFREQPIMIAKDPDLYMRGLHYCLTNLYYLRHYKGFEKIFALFPDFFSSYQKQFNKTSELIYLIYGMNAQLNAHFLKGTFSEGLKLAPRILKEIDDFSGAIDYHRRIVFNYKIAWMHYACGQFEQAVDYLIDINNLKREHLRKDMQCYTRLLLIMLHFDLGHVELVDNLLKSVPRFFKNSDESNELVELIFQGLQKMNGKSEKIKHKGFIHLHKKLVEFQKDRFLKRIFIYFNFTEWALAHRNECTIQDIIQQDYLDYINKRI